MAQHPPPPPPPPPHGPYTVPPFWDFVRTMDPRAYETGYGVDYTTPDPVGPGFPPGFPFGPGGYWGGRGWAGPWGRRGGGHFGGEHARFSPWGEGQNHDSYRGRRCRRGHPGDEETPNVDEEMRDATAAPGERDPEKQDTPETMRESPVGPDGEHPDPPEEAPLLDQGRRRGCPRGGFRGPGGCFGHRHGPHHQDHHHGPSPPHAPPTGPHPPPYTSTPDTTTGTGPGVYPYIHAMMHAAAGHPFAHQVRQRVAQAQAAAAAAVAAAKDAAAAARSNDRFTGGEGDGDDFDTESFVPPMDIFNGPTAWTIHIALPGAKKEDVAVNWNAEKSLLVITGVVYRPGSEEFLASLVTGERKVGLFEKKVKLPPAGSTENKDDVDGDGIAARMEDGLLIVVVPKLEKEWTEVRKVDIE